MKKTLKIVFFLILLVFPFGQLLRLELPAIGPGVTFHPLEGLVLAFGVFWLGGKLWQKKPFDRPLFAKEMLVFGALAAFSLLLNASRWQAGELLTASFYLLRLGNFFLFYLALTDFFKKRNLCLWSFLALEGGVIGFLALAQYLFFPDVRALYLFGWDDHYYRAIGTFLDPGFTGFLLVLAFLALLAIGLKQKKAWQYFLGGFLLVGIGLSFARLSYLALAFGSGVILLARKKIKEMLVLALVFVAVVFFLPKPGGEGVDLWRKSSLLARQENYFRASQIIKKNFWLGVGYNAYRFAQYEAGFLSQEDWQNSHSGAGADNSFLLVWATSGIFGLLAYLFLGARILRESFLKLGQSNQAMILFASTLTLGFASFFINALFYPWILAWTTMLLADFSAESGR